MKSLEQFGSLIELLEYFDTEMKAIQYFQMQRWDGVPVCPHCECDKCYGFSDGKRFKCSKCRKQFTVKIGTIMEDSKISMRRWLVAMYLVANHKKGISSYQLARDLKISQRSAWFMLSRLRFGMGINEEQDKFDGTVEVDETFIGGANVNRHKKKKVARGEGRMYWDKTPVVGMLQEEVAHTIERPHKKQPEKVVKEKVIVQNSKVRLMVIPATTAEHLEPFVLNNLRGGAVLVTDEWNAYNWMHNVYEHHIVNHAGKNYITPAGKSTNALEGFWQSVKLTYNGTHHHYTPEYTQLYMYEAAFRYNTRHLKQGERLNLLTSKFIKGTLKYKQLTKAA